MEYCKVKEPDKLLKLRTVRKTEDKVIDWELFDQLTARGDHIEEIAKRLGVSKPTLYENLRRRLKEYGQH
jgi:transposase